MFLKRLCLALILCGLPLFPLSASMVSFIVVETGLLPDDSGNEYSSLWEDGLMGTFFDAGHVVSNSPILRLEETPAAAFPNEVEGDFLIASQSGADYFILAILEYRNRGGQIKPERISIRIFPAVRGGSAPHTSIYEQQFPAGTGIDLRDEYLIAQEAAKIVAAQIKDR